MTSVDIAKMKEIKTLRLNKGQLFAHYAIVPFLLIVPLFTTYSLFQFYVTKNYTGVRPPHELIDGYVFLIPAIAFYFIQKRRLRFTEISIPVESDTFKKAVEQTAEKLNWTIKNKTNGYVVAVRQGGIWTGGSWGEMITIIKDKDRILINSICDPDNIVSVASFGWNKKKHQDIYRAIGKPAHKRVFIKL